MRVRDPRPLVIVALELWECRHVSDFRTLLEGFHLSNLVASETHKKSASHRLFDLEDID